MGSTTWTSESAHKARNIFKFLQLQHQVGTKETWDDEIVAWEREAFDQALGLPECYSRCKDSRHKPMVAPDKSLHEVCGPVGCGKDQILAACLLAICVFGPKGGIALVWSTKAAKSREVNKACKDFAFRAGERKADGESPFAIGEDLQFHKGVITNPDRNVRVVFGALDTNEATGNIFDWCFCNELQDWKDPEGESVYDHIMSRRHKRGGRISAWTNAPGKPKGQWQRDRWERAKEPDSNWHFQLITVRRCPWIKGDKTTQQEYLEELRAELSPAKFKRLLYCVAADGMEELATAAEIKACTDRKSFALPLDKLPPAGRRFAGVDLSVSRDHTTVCVLRVEPSGLIVLERLDVWVPSKGSKIDLDGEIEPRVLHYGRYWNAQVGIDPWQARQMSQRLERKGVRVEVLDPRSQKLRRESAAAVRSVFKDRRLRLYPEAGKVYYGRKQRNWTDLRQQILDAELKSVGGTDEIVSRRTEAGHGDQLSAFCNALVLAVRSGVQGQVACAGSPARAENERGGRGSMSERYRQLGGRIIGGSVGTWAGRRRL